MRRPLRKMNVERPDLLDDASPEGLRVVQITADPEIRFSHVYMEAQVFSPDSRRLILQRSGTGHEPIPGDPEHQYVLYDLDHPGELIPLTDELNARGPSFSPDGTWVYYFIDDAVPGGGSFTLKRIHPDGSGRETLRIFDAPLRGAPDRLSKLYPLSTISTDGLRLAISGFLGDGVHDDMPWGLAVFDLRTADAWISLQGPTFCNVHPQYSRCPQTPHNRDILVQENHDHRSDAAGKTSHVPGGAGADIHVIADDGANFRTLPWGRDGVEFCQGHQCWRGPTQLAITSTHTCPREGVMEGRLIEGTPVPDQGHRGLRTAGGYRSDLTRDVENPDFYHFAVDRTGEHFIADAGPRDQGWRIYLATLPAQRGRPAEFRYLLTPRAGGLKDTHPHVFLSPDATRAFFNSDESGTMQTYMVEDLHSAFACPSAFGECATSASLRANRSNPAFGYQMASIRSQ